MRRYPVSTRINHVANDDEECSAPVETGRAACRVIPNAADVSPVY
jgi:hypothetical protein